MALHCKCRGQHLTVVHVTRQRCPQRLTIQGCQSHDATTGMPSSSLLWGPCSRHWVGILCAPCRAEPLTCAISSRRSKIRHRKGLLAQPTLNNLWLHPWYALSHFHRCRIFILFCRTRTQLLHTGAAAIFGLVTPVSHLFSHNRTFETTRHTRGLPSGPCVTALSMGPPSSAMNNVRNGLADTTIGVPTLAMTNVPWRTAKPNPRGPSHTVLPMILQDMVMGCGELTTNHTIVLSARAAFKHQNQVDVGATRVNSMVPFLELEMPLARKRRKTGGRGQKMHTAHRDRRRGRRRRIDQRWETQQTLIPHIHLPLDLLRNWSLRRKQQEELMEEAKKGTLGWEEPGMQWLLRRVNSTMSSNMPSASGRGQALSEYPFYCVGSVRLDIPCRSAMNPMASRGI